jgi:hypothetical protein
VAVWGALAALLALPAVAMRFTAEVQWTGFDFMVMGVLLALVGGGYELAVRVSRDIVYQTGFGLAVGAAFLLVWINLAVGVIGSERNPANLMFGAVLAVAAGGAAVARLRAQGMAWTMMATAGAQAIVGVVALVGGMGAGEPNWPMAMTGLTGGFVALWLTSAWLFGRAARA